MVSEQDSYPQAQVPNFVFLFDDEESFANFQRAQETVLSEDSINYKPEKQTDSDNSPLDPQVIEIHVRQGHFVQEVQRQVAKNQSNARFLSGGLLSFRGVDLL